MTPDIKQLIKEVLEKGYLMSLATVDQNGVWVADVIYLHDDDLNIYWISNPNYRHSQAILYSSQVAVSITASEQSGHELGLQISGQASKVEGALFEMEKKHRLKRGKTVPSAPGEILDGESWYKIKPVKIELIHNELFGYVKKKLEL